MNLKLETEFSKADVLKEVDALKKQIDDLRPLPEDLEGKVMQKLRLDWNYNSNAIEGNKLNYGETIALLMHGITAKGKPLKDHLDIQGHDEGIDFLLSIVKEKRQFSEADIRALHKMLLVEPYKVSAQTQDGNPTFKVIKIGEYKATSNHVQTITGETHYYATPEETPAKMQDLMEWYNAVSNNKEVHPVVIAALFHHKFVAIHPFDDGNGRVSRILMNLILMRNNYPPAIIRNDDKQNYYALLSQADVGDSWPFIEYISEQIERSLRLYLKATKGEDIDEDGDIDKEIALFKIELKNKTKVTQKRTRDNISKVTKNEIIPLFKKLSLITNSFNEFFFSNYFYLAFHYTVDKEQKWEYKIVDSIDDNYLIGIKRDFEKIGFDLALTEFRDDKNNFSIKLNYILNFNVYTYSFVNQKNVEILSKYYHESLDTNDQQKIIKLFITDLKNMIQERLNN